MEEKDIKTVFMVTPMDNMSRNNREKAILLLEKCKDREKGKTFVTVRIDDKTIKLVEMEKAKKLGIV